ncbi:MAG: hypothetical protein IJG94_03445 [Clostridia bacterium]|nr:hypothetical protein [Clostridia bacterium]
MQIRNGRIQYYVEGGCEKKLVKILIESRLILPGQADVLNPIQDRIKPAHLRMFPMKASIILIFDTDQTNTDILQQNIRFLKAASNVKTVITIPQVQNLEQELIKCTDIRHIRELVNCAHDSDFKTAFIEEKRLFDKLQLHHFDFKKLWSEEPNSFYGKLGIHNQSQSIKID